MGIRVDLLISLFLLVFGFWYFEDALNLDLIRFLLRGSFIGLILFHLLFSKSMVWYSFLILTIFWSRNGFLPALPIIHGLNYASYSLFELLNSLLYFDRVFLKLFL